LSEWLSLIGLDPSLFGTHSLRRTKATLIYRKTGNTQRSCLEMPVISLRNISGN
jgi:hypothetical protein